MTKIQKPQIDSLPMQPFSTQGRRLVIVLIVLLSAQFMTALVIWKQRQTDFDPAGGLARECQAEKHKEFKHPGRDENRCLPARPNYKV